MSNRSNGSFVHKYAPKKLDDVVFADIAVEQEIHSYVSREDMRPLILYGPNGTGKSSVAKLIPYEFGEGDVFELNPLVVSIEPRIRKLFLQSLQLVTLFGNKTYLFDEIDLLPKSLVETLKLAIDQCGESKRFIATTNRIDALDKGHRSRALCLPLVQASLERWMPRIETIFDAEGVPTPESQVLKVILENSGGDNRRFLADLQRYVEEIKSVQTETV